ncbi:hypothetical protein M0805_003054 [Coniferiporia weirii]|nr:hypothetical protein M0805_003054 [Coniferiporia weirii]
MTRLAQISVLLLSALATFADVSAAPLRSKRQTAITQTAADFKELDYSQFQISDGVGGNAEAEANAVFVDPFAGTDLSTVSSDVLDAVNAMAKAAVAAESADFDPAIAAASGAAADALQVGKIKNKVLKLTGEVQVLNIKIAQAQAAGSDTSSLESDLTTEQTKLTTDIGTDKANAGAASQGVVDSSDSDASSAAASATESASPAVSSAASRMIKRKKSKSKDASATSSVADATATASATDAAATADAAASTSAAVTQTAADFKELDYSQFQISDGVGGDAEAQANAVFVDPFAGTDLSTVSSDVLDAVNAMAKAAVSAEDDLFDPAIAAASGAAADALQVGKIKNKVLKLTGEVQVLNIKIAQAQAAGSDTSSLESDLATEQTKLTTDIGTDKASAGAASQGVA